MKATTSAFIRFSQIVFNIGGRFATHHEKRFVPAFSRSIDHLMDNFESGKRNYCFGTSLEKVSNFDPKICTNPLSN